MNDSLGPPPLKEESDDDPWVKRRSTSLFVRKGAIIRRSTREKIRRDHVLAS
ncbi:Hypothetical protein FKW44_003042 [Caligus rogercresseyi]|uniref:Uncharacterized protein n=1 Tax=Caligus rogercresseyi TaxID=217165 RepID=A0A7T8KLE4_CALRO|nr:Hypothetical protein FKW44_003042 [Caligus rogercresseyi]